VDNGSVDGSENLLRAMFPDIPLLQAGSNLGFAGGNNLGIRYAIDHGADYIFLLNNDTVVDKEAVTALIEAAAADSGAGMLCSKIYFHERANVLWYAGASFYPVIGWGRHRGYGKVDVGQYDQLGETSRPTGCAMMVSRRVCEAIGLLREEMFCYAEDLDWGMRARNAGFKVLYVPASRVWHKVSRSSGGVGSPLSQYYTIRNTLLCLDANAPLPVALRVLRYCTAISAAVLGAFRHRGARIAGVGAIAEGVRHHLQRRYGCSSK
jgi:GT2 family glycosyltransferase